MARCCATLSGDPLAAASLQPERGAERRTAAATANSDFMDTSGRGSDHHTLRPGNQHLTHDTLALNASSVRAEHTSAAFAFTWMATLSASIILSLAKTEPVTPPLKDSSGVPGSRPAVLATNSIRS